MMKYRRLPGKKRGIGRWRTLWAGDDHLLSVDSNGYSEAYTRYYYKDVRAVFIRRTPGGKIGNIVFASVLCVSLIALLASIGDGIDPGTVTLAMLSSFLLGLLAVNVLRGPTCRCHILMPLGIHELPTLKRLRTAHRVLGLIRPRIEGIQGALKPEETRAAAAPPAAPVPSLPRAAGKGGTADGMAAARDYRGGMHYAAFSLLIGESIFGLASLRADGGDSTVVFVLLTLALFACLITAAVKQNDSRVPRLAGRLVWLAIGGMAFAIVSGYYAGIFLHAMHARSAAQPVMDTAVIATLASHPAFPYLMISFSAACALVGISGMLSCLRWKRAAGASETCAPTPDGDAAP